MTAKEGSGVLKQFSFTDDKLQNVIFTLIFLLHPNCIRPSSGNSPPPEPALQSETSTPPPNPLSLSSKIKICIFFEEVVRVSSCSNEDNAMEAAAKNLIEQSNEEEYYGGDNTINLQLHEPPPKLA